MTPEPIFGRRHVRLATALSCFVLIVLAFPASGSAEPFALEPGDGRFLFQDPAENTGKKVPVWYFKPKDFTSDTPIVFVMHGVSRNADGYRNAWIYLAEHHKLLILAPEFTKENFPKSHAYALGGVMTRSADGGRMPAPESKWAFYIVDRIFDRVRAALPTRLTRFALFGHSAGAQFVHRYMTFTGGEKVAIALAANAGWYTLPDDTIAFPYGLGGTGLPKTRVAQAFGKEMVVMLGDKDRKQGRHLRRTSEAMQQGPNRLERGKYYLEAARQQAAELGVPFDWRIVIVPGVGHSNAGMAPMAAKIVSEHFKSKR